MPLSKSAKLLHPYSVQLIGRLHCRHTHLMPMLAYTYIHIHSKTSMPAYVYLCTPDAYALPIYIHTVPSLRQHNLTYAHQMSMRAHIYTQVNVQSNLQYTLRIACMRKQIKFRPFIMCCKNTQTSENILNIIVYNK